MYRTNNLSVTFMFSLTYISSKNIDKIRNNFRFLNFYLLKYFILDREKPHSFLKPLRKEWKIPYIIYLAYVGFKFLQLKLRAVLWWKNTWEQSEGLDWGKLLYF